MLELISLYSTKFLASKLNISEDAFSIYKYGFTLLYSMVFSAISICTLSFILFDSPIYAIIFIFVFVSIRIYSGGFHAKTYLSCFILNNLFFIIIMFVALSMRDFYFLFPIFSLFSSFNMNVGVKAALKVKTPLKHFNTEYGQLQSDSS